MYEWDRGASEGQKALSHPMELELKMAVHHQVGGPLQEQQALQELLTDELSLQHHIKKSVHMHVLIHPHVHEYVMVHEHTCVCGSPRTMLAVILSIIIHFL